jgi:hypothetical protein
VEKDDILKAHIAPNGNQDDEKDFLRKDSGTMAV